MSIHFTPSTPVISDLTLHLQIPESAGPEQMEIRSTFFPAEWFPQSGVQLTWPHAGTDWADILAEVDNCYVSLALEILVRNELLLIVTPEPERIKGLLHERIPSRLLPHIRYFVCPTNDTWARDHGFLTLMTEAGPRLLDFQFNGWGNKFPSDLDNQICRRLFNLSPSSSPSSPSPSASPLPLTGEMSEGQRRSSSPSSASPLPLTGEMSEGQRGSLSPTASNSEGQRRSLSPLHGTYESHLDFVFEGGSIESDGRGTLLTTSECLLSPNRNPDLTRLQIEERLLRAFHADRVLWLDHGYLAGDDTDSHIDTLARFCPNDTIAYVQCTDPSDEHYEALKAMEEQLQTFSPHPSILDTASTMSPTEEATKEQNQPSSYRLIPLPLPDPIYDPEDGHRLPATYANFLIVNGAVLMPTYGQPVNDEKARSQLQKAFPKHAIVPIDCRVLIRQHGSLHCSTMQFPVGVLG